MLFDFRDFLKCNRGKLFLLAAVALAGIVLGIRGGFAVNDATVYLHSHQTNVFLLIADRKSIFGFFFVELITYLAILVLLTFASAHFLLSYLCFAILFFRSYLFALHMCLYIMCFKLSVLPFILVCWIPCFLISMCIFATVTILTVNRACEMHKYGAGCGNTWQLYIQKMLVPCIMLVILSILCGILTYFTTLGIIL